MGGTLPAANLVGGHTLHASCRSSRSVYLVNSGSVPHFRPSVALATLWRSPLAWEDVMLGLLLEDVADPQDHFGERWYHCWACF